MLTRARSNDLMIGNAEGKYDGAFTWSEKAVLQHSLQPDVPGIYETLTTMKVDEDGSGNLVSDYNHLKLILTIHNQNGEADRMEKLNQEQHASCSTEREIKRMAAMLEYSNILFSS